MTSQRSRAIRFVTASIRVISVCTLLIAFALTAIAQNPVPLLNQPLIPDAIVPGGAGFTLTVNGAGFVSTSTINWNGKTRATTFVSSAQLTAAILASDIVTPSTAEVTVVNPSPGGGLSNTAYFSTAVAKSTASFSPAVIYPSGTGGGYFLAIADVNGDGKPDLIVANGNGGLGTDGSVAVSLGNADGTFQPAVSFDAGGLQTISVAVADVNGDGKPDLVVANSESSTVGVLLGNGDGTFRPVVTYRSGGSPWSVAVADVNGDGKPDILAGDASSCYGCSGGGLVGVLLGNGDGTFRRVVTYRSGGSSFETSPTAIAVADLTGDGKLDVVMTNYCSGFCNVSSEGSVSVLLGNGDGAFQSAVSYESGGVGLSIGAVAVADVNGDGTPDLLVTNSNCVYGGTCEQGSIGVLLGNGNGTFQPAVLYGSGAENATSVAVADVNGDGKPDLVVTNFCSPGGCAIPGTGSVGVLQGNGDGTFQPAVTYNPDGYWGAFSTAVVDVNEDGRPDLIVVNFASTTGSSVAVLLNGSGSCVGKCATSTSLSSSLNPSTYGQSVTWIATVTTAGSTPPTGKVYFNWDIYTIGSATLNSSGVASFTRSNLNADSYPLTAVYLGDADNLLSTSAVLNQAVTETTSSATLTSSPNPSTSGEAVTFTATISSGTVKPTGPVTFALGKTVLGTAELSGGKAKFIYSTLPVGSNVITATFYGDSNISQSSASVTQTVSGSVIPPVFTIPTTARSISCKKAARPARPPNSASELPPQISSPTTPASPPIPIPWTKSRSATSPPAQSSTSACSPSGAPKAAGLFPLAPTRLPSSLSPTPTTAWAWAAASPSKPAPPPGCSIWTTPCLIRSTMTTTTCSCRSASRPALHSQLRS